MIKNILQLLEDNALNDPTKTALIDEKREVSYASYFDESQRIGSALAALHPDELYSKPIIVFVDRRVDTVIAFMGVLYSGNFYVPIDTKTPIERLKSIIEVVNPIAFISFSDAESKLVENLNSQLPNYAFHDFITQPIDKDKLERIRANAIDLDPVYAIFTSGSTGIPKAVAISHRAVIDLSYWLVSTFSFQDDDVIGNQTPFYFDASVKDIYLSLRAGATLLVIPQKCFSFPQLLVETLNKHEVTTLLWATSAVVLIAKSGILEALNLTRLRRLFFAGEAMYGKHLNMWKSVYPNCQYINLYGPTEVTVDSTFYIVNREFKDSDVIPIGSNCDNKRIYILNENNQIVDGKQGGELAVGGSGVALGYYNNSLKTNEVFIQNPHHNHYRDILYKTGDYVKLNELNEIEFVGRKDFQVKHMGNRIELGEIEAAVYNLSHIKHAACVYDTLNEKIILFYTAEIEILATDFLKTMALSIPKYMFPNKFIRLPEMPFNANGKVDRKAILNYL
jgi:amino acid adenylation domain-containing protein